LNDGLCGIIGAIQVARQTIKFFKKRNAWALSKHKDAASTYI